MHVYIIFVHSRVSNNIDWIRSISPSTDQCIILYAVFHAPITFFRQHLQRLPLDSFLVLHINSSIVFGPNSKGSCIDVQGKNRLDNVFHHLVHGCKRYSIPNRTTRIVSCIGGGLSLAIMPPHLFVVTLNSSFRCLIMI